LKSSVALRDPSLLGTVLKGRSSTVQWTCI
jgi:hypothetical protein